MTDPSVGMGARAAWAWLTANPGHGVRTGPAGRIHAYKPTIDRVEVNVAGTDTSHDMRESDFLSDFSEATFYPINTSEVVV